VWLYVLIDIAVGADLGGFVPADFFARVAGPSNPFAVPVTVLLGIPLYFNAAGTIPIVDVLLAKGLPIGTVLALMMSIIYETRDAHPGRCPAPTKGSLPKAPMSTRNYPSSQTVHRNG
jgi:hypothetical protein